MSMNASKAQEVEENIVWEIGSLEKALAYLERMPHVPSVQNLEYILHKCRGGKNLTCTKRLHAYMRKNGLEDHRSFGNYLVPMLVQVGSMCDAEQVFSSLVVRNVYSWTSLIIGYIECGESQHALNLYWKMQEDSVRPSRYTFVALLKACARLKDVERGREIHAEIAERGLEKDRFIGNTLVDMYAKCGSLARAREVFDKLPVRDVVSWTALITGYAEHGLAEEALDCLEQMQMDDVSPNAVTFLCSLKACGSVGAIDKGQEIHTEIARKGLERDLFVGSTLVDMYAKCGFFAKAQEVLDKLSVRNEVSWNALIAGYAEHGLAVEALNCLEQMQLEGVSPDAVTFVCSLKACGCIGATDQARDIHTVIARKGLERELFIGNTLVDMYAKCGWLGEALEVFEKLSSRDEVSWNALIAGYAHLGDSDTVFHMLERMRGDGIKPGEVTFLNVLTVCSHTGFVDKGEKYFEAMSTDYGIAPTIEHHTCMVDLLGRAGQLDKAVAMVKKMPFHPNCVVWHNVLGACRKWGNVELGRQAFERALQLDEKDPAAYILMSNIYADAHMQQEEEEVEALRVKEQAWKIPGQGWWTDQGRIVHSFLVGNTTYSQSKEIFVKL